jgi:hypothetical protein
MPSPPSATTRTATAPHDHDHHHRKDHVVSAARRIDSPDSLELIRTRCPDCGYQVAVAIWCHNPKCCNQSPFGFLVEELALAQAARRFNVFAVRYPHPLPAYSPDVPVRVWRAGSAESVFEGRLEDAVRFGVRHDCSGRDTTEETTTS